MLKPLPDFPTVGVYALTYNHEDFVARAIDSVLAQDWPSDRLKIVLLDDGSTDATPERVKPYEQQVTYVRQPNQGINAAVSRLLSLAEGDVLIPLSCDDEWPTDRIERTIDFFRANPEVGMVYGDMEAIDETGTVIVPSMLGHLEGPPQDQIAGDLLGGNFISGGSLAFRGELRPAMLPIPTDAAWEDWWFAWALTNVTRIGYIDAVVYRYRRHGSNFIFGLGERDPAAMIERHAAEVPFRRHLLGSVLPGTCTFRELMEGTQGLGRQLLALEAAGRPPETVMEVTDAQRAAARRLVTYAAGQTTSSPVLAAFAAARAIAADPINTDAHRIVQSLPDTPRSFLPSRLDGVRAITVFADAAELADAPTLLETYVEATAGSDDVTLVTVGHGWDADQLFARLGPVVEQVPGADGLDILALPDVRAVYLSGLLQTDAALGLPDLPVPGMPRFTDADALREHLALRRRFPLRRL